MFLFTALVAIVCMSGPSLFYWFVETFLESSRNRPSRSHCTVRLKNVVVALDGYQLGGFPPAHTADSSGHRLHSWRTLILPRIEQQPLFNRITLQQPWNAPVNSPFVSLRMPIYQCPKQSGTQNQSSYVAVTGPGTVWPDPAKPGITHPALPLDKVVVLVELNGLNLPWMEPRDVDIASLIHATQTTPPSPMFDCHPYDTTPRVNVAFADIHVDGLSPAVLAAALQKMQQAALNPPAGGGNPTPLGSP
ncbi:MAG: DUF1559 domain-containing protein [Planctomycetes bacterium]|nr:DUF1559 domain-containing protein [Planctomycetota bacterium]